MEKERDRLHQQLIKLGDMMGDGLHYEDPSISREYKRICKILYPDMFPRKRRKPNQKLINTLKPCDCGQKGWTYHRHDKGTVSISCKKCLRNTGEQKSSKEAVKKWNSFFDNQEIIDLKF